MKNTLIINGCSLVSTCSACPEQYDVFFKDFQIGYLRLRRGNFTAEYPDCGGVLAYDASPRGEGMFGDSERFRFLEAAVTALLNTHNAAVIERIYSPVDDY